MTSVCLALNVRDAEQHIGRCITSALKFPGVDRALIIDTGSEDDTVAVARSALGDLPATFRKEPWEGHAHNRTLLLREVKETGADYCLMLDADMELIIDGEVPPLDRDEYMLPIRDRGLLYPLPLLTSTRRDFSYAGVAHAYLCCNDGPSDGVILEQVTLVDHGGGGHREGKIERDAELLAAEVGKNPADARSWFYLANSYRDLDQIEKAIHCYKFRSSLGGWSEEVYNSLYQAGVLLCEHVNYYEGAKLLIAAAEMKPNRAEALRALAGCSTSVANKLTMPKDEVLFVEPGAYTKPLQEVRERVVDLVPPLPPIAPLRPRRRPRVTKRRGLDPRDVSAIIVTRGNVDLDPVVQTLPYDDIVVWNNMVVDPTWDGGPAVVAKQVAGGRLRVIGGADYKCFGRYAAIPYTKNPVIFWVDDDVIFTEHESLLALYEPGRLVTNMDPDWVRGAGYEGVVALQGAGSLCDAWLPAKIWERYLAVYPFDDEALVEADFAFGTLVPHTIADLGYDTREFSDDPDRLYQQPGQTGRKWDMIQRARMLLQQQAA